MTSAPARLLLIRLSALGDVIQALYTVPGLRRAFPEAVIDFAVEKPFAPLVECVAGLGKVWILDRKSLFGKIRKGRLIAATKELLAIRRNFRQTGYDLSLDFQGNLRSAGTTLLAGAKVRSGPAKNRAKEMVHFLYDQKLDVPDLSLNKVLVNQEFARQVGALPQPSDRPEIRLPEGVDTAVAESLKNAGLPERDFILLHPGVSSFGAYKRYEESGYVAAIRPFLLKTNKTILLSFGPGEEIFAENIAREIHSPRVRKAPATPSVLHLSALIRRAAWMGGSDSGPLHLAALFEKRVLGIYGPKNPVRYGPWGTGHHILEPDDLSMRKLRRHARKTPITITELPPEKMLAALLDMEIPQ